MLSSSPGIVRRWLTAVALRASAADVASRGSPVEAAGSLVAADAASETVLGILADLSGDAPAPKESHEGLIKLARQTAAKAGASIPAEVMRAVRVAHGDRNHVVHHGQEPGPRMVDEALRGADGLLEVLAEALPALRVVPSGAGVASAVAALIDAPELAGQLRAAEAAVAAGDVREALKACSIGHEMLLHRALPPVKSSRDHRGGRFWRGDRPELREVEARVESHDERLSPLERWLVPMALGTSPADYDRFRNVVGWSFQTFGGWQHGLPGDPGDPKVERTEPLPSVSEARWALGELTRMVLRLWEMRALAEGDDEAVFEAMKRYW